MEPRAWSDSEWRNNVKKGLGVNYYKLIVIYFLFIFISYAMITKIPLANESHLLQGLLKVTLITYESQDSNKWFFIATLS